MPHQPEPGEQLAVAFLAWAEVLCSIKVGALEDPIRGADFYLPTGSGCHLEGGAASPTAPARQRGRRGRAAPPAGRPPRPVPLPPQTKAGEQLPVACPPWPWRLAPLRRPQRAVAALSSRRAHRVVHKAGRRDGRPRHRRRPGDTPAERSHRALSRGLVGGEACPGRLQNHEPRAARFLGVAAPVAASARTQVRPGGPQPRKGISPAASLTLSGGMFQRGHDGSFNLSSRWSSLVSCFVPRLMGLAKILASCPRWTPEGGVGRRWGCPASRGRPLCSHARPRAPAHPTDTSRWVLPPRRFKYQRARGLGSLLRRAP